MYQCFTLGEWNLLDTTLETRHRIVSSSLEIPTSFCRNPLAEGMDHIELHLRSRAEMDVLDHATDLDETSGRRGIVYSCGRRSKEGNKLTEPRVPAKFKCLDTVDVPMVLAIGFNPQRQVLKVRRVEKANTAFVMNGHTNHAGPEAEVASGKPSLVARPD